MSRRTDMSPPVSSHSKARSLTSVGTPVKKNLKQDIQRLQTVIKQMQSRKPENNIAFMKNLLGTIKVMGVPSKLKVN